MTLAALAALSEKPPPLQAGENVTGQPDATPHPPHRHPPPPPAGNIGYGLLCASTALYSLDLPYRQDGTGDYGFTPRALSLVIATMLTADNNEWDARTRTLKLGPGFHRLAQSAGLNNSIHGIQHFKQSLLALRDQPLNIPGHAPIPITETDTLSQHDGTMGASITFTPEYTVAADTSPATPVNAATVARLTGEPYLLDLLMLATSYCPDEARMDMPLDAISVILPHAGQDATMPRMRGHVERLNALQHDWRFTLNEEEGTVRAQWPNVPDTAPLVNLKP